MSEKSLKNEARITLFTTKEFNEEIEEEIKRQKKVQEETNNKELFQDSINKLKELVEEKDRTS